MRIAIVNSWYYPNMKGGAEQSTKLIAESLAQNGNSICVLTGDGEKTPNFEVINKNIKIFRIQTRITRSASNRFVSKILDKLFDMENYSIVDKLNTFFQKFKPDVVYTNSLTGLSPIVWKIAVQNGIPVVHTVRDYSLISPRGIAEFGPWYKPYELFRRFYAHQTKVLSKNVNFVTAPSRLTLETIIKDGHFTESQKQVVVNAVPLALDDVKKNIDFHRTNFKINKHVRAIFVGRLIKIKGIEELLNAFSEIPNNNLELVICGDGPLRDELEKKFSADTRIRFTGQLNQENLLEEFKFSDFCVFPSIWDEPFGRVIIEANMNGLPVLATNHGGVPEIMKRLKSGPVVDPEDEGSFKQKLNEMFIKHSYEDYYANILRNISYYSLESQRHAFEKIFLELVKRNED